MHIPDNVKNWRTLKHPHVTGGSVIFRQQQRDSHLSGFPRSPGSITVLTLMSEDQKNGDEISL